MVPHPLEKGVPVLDLGERRAGPDGVELPIQSNLAGVGIGWDRNGAEPVRAEPQPIGVEIAADYLRAGELRPQMSHDPTMSAAEVEDSLWLLTRRFDPGQSFLADAEVVLVIPCECAEHGITGRDLAQDGYGKSSG
jgi:hypothetical protein